jgi:hypothetical protein
MKIFMCRWHGDRLRAFDRHGKRLCHVAQELLLDGLADLEPEWAGKAEGAR